LTGYMKQRRIGEHAVEMVVRQIKLEKILLPYFASAMGARHCSELRGAFQTYCAVTEFGKHFQVAPSPAAKIQYPKRRLTFDVSQQRRDVLGDVVIAGAAPKIVSMLVVIVQGEMSDFFQILRIGFHNRKSRPGCGRLFLEKLGERVENG